MNSENNKQEFNINKTIALSICLGLFFVVLGLYLWKFIDFKINLPIGYGFFCGGHINSGYVILGIFFLFLQKIALFLVETKNRMLTIIINTFVVLGVFIILGKFFFIFALILTAF